MATKAQKALRAKVQQQMQQISVSEETILEALESLYDDDVQPYGRILIQRLRERRVLCAPEEQEAEDGNGGSSSPLIDPKHFRSLCEAIPAVTVESDYGADFLLSFKDRPHEFVDPLSREDPYPEELWDNLADYFQTLSPSRIPGGRYAAASWLVAQNLDFLADYKLGEVCHIIQLALCTHRLLGYTEKYLVPYADSKEHLKGVSAQFRQRTVLKQAAKQLPVASMAEVRHNLRQLLEFETGPEPRAIVVANVKRLFRSRFKLELSETALGHPRLRNLLLDPSLQDMCRLSTANGQHVVMLAEAAQPGVQNPAVVPQAASSSSQPQPGRAWSNPGHSPASSSASSQPGRSPFIEEQSETASSSSQAAPNWRGPGKFSL